MNFDKANMTALICLIGGTVNRAPDPGHFCNAAAPVRFLASAGDLARLI